MKENLGWIAKNILLPLLPFLIGALLRIISSGDVNRNSFDSGELAFSMAMLSIIVMGGAHRLNDKALRESLVAIFTVEAAFFLALFACASLIKVQIDNGLSETMVQIGALLKTEPLSSSSISSLINDKHQNNNLLLLSRIRSFVLVVAAVMVPLTIAFKVRYKLED